MTFLHIARLTIRQSRRGYLGWLLGLAGLTLLYSASFASIGAAKSAAISDYPASLKKALNLGDLSTPAGYLNSTTFGIPLLLLTGIFVISTATRDVAGDEESGALDLLLSYPLTRTKLLLARAATIAAMLVFFAVVVFGLVLALRSPTKLHVGVGALAAVTFTWLLLGWSLAGIALLVSAASGRRSVSLAASTALVLLAYLADSFLPLIAHLGWLADVSPFGWFIDGDPLVHGLQWRHCALLLASAALSVLLAVFAFDRRDLDA